MGYTRGSRDDWDQWAEITGDEGLSWDKMLPLMIKVNPHNQRVFTVTDFYHTSQKNSA